MTPTSPGDASSTPETVGRYEIVPGTPPVATGALGDLCKARIASGPEVGRAVLVRRLRRTPALDVHAVECLTNAGFSAMELRHPKIAAVLDVVVADSEIALVSEQIGGVPLAVLLRGGADGKRQAVPPAAALRIGVDLLEALDAVREPWAEIVPPAESDDERIIAAGVHGGVTPDGVLVATFGEAMLLEAGLSGVALAFPAVLDHAEAIAYRAPEQLEKKGLPDERSDVFTVGVLLWELIAGRSLFGQSIALPRPGAPRPVIAPRPGADAAQLSTLRRKVLGAPIQRLDTMPLLKGKVTKELANLVARCLERNPTVRFQTLGEASAAIVALGSAVGDHPAVAALLGDAAAESEEQDDSHRSRIASTRPTVPPEDDRATIPPETRRREGDPPAETPVASKAETERAALGLPGIVEPSGVPPTIVESVLPMTADVESIPPSSRPPTESESLFPGDEVESIPPSMSVPPVTEQSAVAPPAPLPAPVETESAPPPSISLPPVTAGDPPPLIAPPAFPVVEARPAASVEPARAPPRLPPAGGDKRMIVVGVMIAAGLLALIAGARALFSSDAEESKGGESSAARPADSAPAAPAPSPPKVEERREVPPAPSAAAEPEPAEAAPTAPPAVPSAAVPLPKKKKKVFRPTGI